MKRFYSSFHRAEVVTALCSVILLTSCAGSVTAYYFSNLNPHSLSAPSLYAFPGNGRTTLTWGPINGASSYNIYWDTQSTISNNSQKITGVTSPYTHTGRTNGTAYFYAVTAVNSQGKESALSVVSGTRASQFITLPQNGPGYTKLPAGVHKIIVSGNTIYAATNGGLAVSKDGGASFQTFSSANGLADNAIEDFTLSGGTLYAVTWGGISISTNGGVSWSTVAGTTGSTGTSLNLSNLYVSGSLLAAGSNASPPNGITSSDGGVTWLQASSHGINYPIKGFSELSGTLFAATTHGLYSSSNGGSTWSANASLGTGSLDGTYTMGSTIYAWKSLGGGLEVSTNGGSSWTLVTTVDGLTSNSINCLFAFGTALYAGTPAGLSVSYNGGMSWSSVNLSGVSSTSIKSVFVDGTGIYLGTSAGLSISSDGGNSWTNHDSDTQSPFFTQSVAISGSNLYAASQNEIYVSQDGGLSWAIITPAGLSSDTISYNSGFSVGGSTICAAGSTTGLYLSKNGGTSWSNITTAQGLVSNTAYSVYCSGSTIMVGTLSGLSVSVNGGSSWTTYNSTNEMKLTDITAVYADGTTYYAGGDGTLEISTNGGGTWTDYSLDLNGWALGIYASGPNIYVATEFNQVYFSTNSGATWTRPSLNINTLFCTQIGLFGSALYFASEFGGFAQSTDSGNTWSYYSSTSGVPQWVSGFATSGTTIYLAGNGGIMVNPSF